MPEKTICGTDASAVLSFAEYNYPLLFLTLLESYFTGIISCTKFTTLFAWVS